MGATYRTRFPSGSATDELTDNLGEPRGLVQGDERVAVFYLDQLTLREEFGEAPAVLGWHHPVLAGPDHQGGMLEVRQAFGRPEQEAGVGHCCSQHPHCVAADLRLGQDRL